VALGRALGKALEAGMLVYLRGDLGAGKTTLARGILHGLGHTGRVKSPTYALVEVYKLSRLYLYHFDFYRLEDAHAWIDAGFREHFNAQTICLVEWPEHAGGTLPPADIDITLDIVDHGRDARIGAHTDAGRRCLSRLAP